MANYLTRYGDTLVGIALAKGLCNAVGTSSCIKAADRIAYANAPTFEDWTVDDYSGRALPIGMLLEIPSGQASQGTVDADPLTITGGLLQKSIFGLLAVGFVFYLMNKS